MIETSATVCAARLKSGLLDLNRTCTLIHLVSFRSRNSFNISRTWRRISRSGHQPRAPSEAIWGDRADNSRGFQVQSRHGAVVLAAPARPGNLARPQQDIRDHTTCDPPLRTHHVPEREWANVGMIAFKPSRMPLSCLEGMPPWRREGRPLPLSCCGASAASSSSPIVRPDR
jgi:hypothetical protein